MKSSDLFSSSDVDKPSKHGVWGLGGVLSRGVGKSGLLYMSYPPPYQVGGIHPPSPTPTPLSTPLFSV